MLRHMLNILDLENAHLDHILSVASKIAKNPSLYSEVAKGKILATLFFEPSTRTRLSFESAMFRMGGKVLGFSDAAHSSTAKGESPVDTAHTVSCYCDIIACRHPMAFTPHQMSEVSSVPIINAGDGTNEHPTQTLTDLVTIYERFGRISNLTIGLCGDLKYGRTVHSLVKMLARFPGNRFVLISPDALRLPRDVEHLLTDSGVPFTLCEDMGDVLPELDVLYMTRVQAERFDDPAQYLALKGVYILTPEKMTRAKRDMIVMHPLPRVDEIDLEVDQDDRAWYFKQVQYGVYARMALMMLLLELGEAPNKEGNGCKRKPYCFEMPV